MTFLDLMLICICLFMVGTCGLAFCQSKMNEIVKQRLDRLNDGLMAIEARLETFELSLEHLSDRLTKAEDALAGLDIEFAVERDGDLPAKFAPDVN